MRRLIGFALVVVVAAGCGGQATKLAGAASGGSSGSHSSKGAASRPDVNTHASTTTQASRSGSASNVGSSATTSGRATTALPATKPTQGPLFPLSATVSPACVRPGGVATLVVHAPPRASVAFQAVYAGNKGGATPPFGYGYGGNADGYIGPDGTWTSSWTLRPDTPAGPAYIELAVAHTNRVEQNNNTKFRVANPVTGTC